MSTLLVNNIKSVTGDTVTISGSNIIVQGNTTLGDGLGTDNLTVNGNSAFTGSVEVTGSINVLHGSVKVRNFGSDGLDVTGNSAFTGSVGVSGSINVVQGSVSALNGVISGSGVAATGVISGATGSFGLIQSNFNGLKIKINGDTIFGNSSDDTHTFTGAITASGNISASGDLAIGGDEVNFTNLPTVDPGVLGRLFTQSGSQLPFSGSAAELNAISGSKFVIISAG